MRNAPNRRDRPQGPGSLRGDAPCIQATVIGVSDGDTMRVQLADGNVERLRFESIDAPESDQPFGEEATLLIEGKALNKEVTVTASGRDQYNRLIAKIEVEGEELNTELLKAGLAWWFYHYSDELDLAALEAESKANRRGLFASDTPIYPRIWRRGARIPEPLSVVDSNIVILASLPNPAGTDTGNETVILGNQGNDDQDLAGWALTDDDGDSFALDGLSVPARGALTVTLDDGLQLGNRGDEITLRNPGNQAASVLRYNVAENGRFVFR